jgi:hypothetical protein
MKNLNLEKLWQVSNKLLEKQEELFEDGKYAYLLGKQSSFYGGTFERFLEYYSFKIEEDKVVVFNDDPIPYEQYSKQDFSYIPIVLLSFSAEKLEKWIENEVDAQLKEIELEKLADKERIKEQINRLQKQLKA